MILQTRRRCQSSCKFLWCEHWQEKRVTTLQLTEMDEDGEPATQADFDIGLQELIVETAAEPSADEHENNQMEEGPPDEESRPSSQPNSQE